jgi:CCR4-NOT transcription complex subunit 6
VGSAKTFLPTAADVGRRFRLECTAVGLDGAHLFGPRSIRIEPVLSSPPPTPKRQLVAVKGAANGGGYRFRVVSYNVLAEIYATQQMSPHCDAWALGWSYRLPNLLRELRDAAADVLCLQEVQADHYERCFKPWMADNGFDGLFKHKTREHAMGKVDGCAIFWRRSKFRLSEQYSIEFNECARTLTQVCWHLWSQQGGCGPHHLTCVKRSPPGDCAERRARARDHEPADA